MAAPVLPSAMVLRARPGFKQDASTSLLTPLSHHRRSPRCAPSAPLSVLLAVPGLSCFTPRQSKSALREVLMRRRQVIALLALSAGARPLASRAQTGIKRVGVIYRG